MVRRGINKVMTEVAKGLVHDMPADLRSALVADTAVLACWQGCTDIGRNEFICWVEDAKQPETRKRRIERTCEELLEGKKRPCCWVGCIHRTDKAPSRWQQSVLIDKQPRKALIDKQPKKASIDKQPRKRKSAK
jgi:hypothetical protein